MAYSKKVVSAVQANINQLGYTPALVVDGVEGPKTDAGVVWARNNGASVYGESNSLAKITDGFLAAVGVQPDGQNMGPAKTVVQKSPSPQSPTPPPVYYPPVGPAYVPPPAPAYVQPPTPLNVKPPPPPAPSPTPVKPSPAAAAKVSPIPAAAGAAAGAGLGWFAVGGPIAAFIGAVVGGASGFFVSKSVSKPAMGAEFGGERPTTRYFSATLTAIAHKPASYYRYAPKVVVDKVSSWAAGQLQLPRNAMGTLVYRIGAWEARRSGASITLYGPPYSRGMAHASR